MNNRDKSGISTAVWTVLRRNVVLSAGMIAVIACDIVFALLPPMLLEFIVNRLTLGLTVPLMIAVGYFLLLVLSGLMDSAQTVFITRFGQKITHQLRLLLCTKLQKLPAGYDSKTSIGKTVSLFVNDVDTVGILFDEGIISLFADACKIIGILIVIFTRSMGLGILILFIMPLLFLMTRMFQKRMLTAQLNNRAAIARVNNHVPETIQNIRMVHTFSKQDYMQKRYDTYIQESYHSIEKANLYDSIYSPIILFTSSAVIALMMVLSAMGGGVQEFFGMSVGSAVAIIAYVGKIFTPLESIGMEIENIQSAVAGISRIDEFLHNTERTMPDIELTDDTPELLHAIRFQNVTFGYEAEKPVICNLSLDVRKGENITLAGRTGAGKSTIFRLILGLYSPQQGEVQIFGQEAHRLKDSQKRQLFGYVEQALHLVNGTVGEQISLFDPEISREQVMEAARVVGLDEMIEKLPQGYDTPCDTKLFSQGQLQLLSIARAIVANPQMLLLDEITANLDSGTEKMVMDALTRVLGNRTVISISHRLYEQSGSSRLIQI